MQPATIQAEKGTSNPLTFDEILMYGGGDDPLEGDWDDQEDEDESGDQTGMQAPCPQRQHPQNSTIKRSGQD